MIKTLTNFRIGLRTVKTTAAVIISMIIVYFYGTTDSRMIFAMLGAMNAVMPTFKESLESCLTQIVGVLFGAMIGIVLKFFPIHPLVGCGVGILLIISLYNTFRLRFSPTLACLIVVTLFISPDTDPFHYASGRIWDTAIGLGVGMLINTLVFPYDNSARIRATVLSLDKEIIRFLEDMFDGDDQLPDAEEMIRTIDQLAKQLEIFENQMLLRDRRRQKKQLATFRTCAVKARQLVAHMEVLAHMGRVGHLSRQTLARLHDCGADVRNGILRDSLHDVDLVTNYHVAKLLTLRDELLDALEQ